MGRSRWIAVLALVAGGCGEDESLPEPEPVPYVYPYPADLWTALGADFPITARVEETFTVGRADEVLESMHLVTWPELEEVETTPSRLDGGGGVYLELRPAAPLQDRWYAVVYRGLPSDVLVNGAVATSQGPMTRFRPDSQPVVSFAEIVRVDREDLVHVGFSEALAAQRPARDVLSLRVNGRAFSCEASYYDDEEAGGIIDGTLACDRVPRGADVEVRMTAGLTGLTGLPLPPTTLRAADVDVPDPGASLPLAVPGP